MSPNRRGSHDDNTSQPRNLLQPVIAAAEAAGRTLAAEFARPDGPRGGAGHADVDDEIEAVPAPSWQASAARLSRSPCYVMAFLSSGLSMRHYRPTAAPDTIAWSEGLDHLLRNGAPIARMLADATLSAGAIVFVSQAAPEWPVGNARAVSPARFVALPSIAYRLARAAAGDGVAAVSLNSPCGWDYAAGHALIRGAGGVLLDESGRDVTYTMDGRPSAVSSAAQ